MIENCPHCNKDLKELKPTQKGQHISGCILNPNHKSNVEKRTETRLKNRRINNPILHLKLNCSFCGKEFEIDVVESYFNRGRYRKCCSKKCSNNHSIKDYKEDELKNDKCKNCGADILVKKRTKIGISVCKNCKKITIAKWKNNKLIKNILKENFKNENIEKYVVCCKFCGDEICKRPDVCKKFRQKNNVFVKYFGFDINKIGCGEFYNEFDRIVEKLKIDYFKNEMSLTDMGEKYNMNYQTLSEVFKRLNIKIRTLSESVNSAILSGKLNYDDINTYPYKIRTSHYLG